MRLFSVAIASALALGCAKQSEPQVVVYTSVDDMFARPICERFQNESGIQVRLVPDTEETKSTGLVNRLIAEKDRPQADVFWSGDPVRASILKSKGVSAPYHSTQVGKLPAQFSDSEGHWTGFSSRARVLIYHTSLVPAGQEPKSVIDLLDARFKGKVCIASPLFGTTSMHAAALFESLGDAEAKKFFEGLIANGGRILSSNGEVRRRVANGEYAVGITDTDDCNVAKQEGKPVGVVFPDQEGMGVVLVPNCVLLVANGPNAENGKRFIDYLLQAGTEAALARSAAAQIPLRSDVSLPEGFPFPPIHRLKAMPVDYAKLAGRLDELSRGFLKEWVDRNSR
ncbi:MAG: iron ABC transporter substrate-binding protein [Planctomycetes bacterium RBG_16_64_10]|nr:MAG: iron ABC transporter substrate-binding protein [Planctomycetes bacterium RBG_16_64_10]